MNGTRASASHAARAFAALRNEGLWAQAWIELASRRHGVAAANQRVTVLRPVVVTGRA